MARPKSSPSEIEQRHQKIVAGARHCFAVYGFEGTTVEHLERHCGYTRGTLFRYLPSKAAMLAAVVAVEETTQRLQYETVLGASPPELSSALEDVLLLQLRRAHEDPVPTRLRLELLALGQRDKRWSKRISALEQQQREWRRGLLKKALAASQMKPSIPVEQLIDALSVVFFGLATFRALDAPMPSTDQALARALAGMLGSVMVKRKDTQRRAARPKP